MRKGWTRSTNGRLTVHFGPVRHAPIGALVRIRTSDGRARVQRHGSAYRSHLSQVLQPLHFGVPAGVRLQALHVLWPGTTAWVPVELPPRLATGWGVHLRR